MKIRVIGAAVALVLAVIGTVGVLGYVSGADDRALAGTKTVDVLVVTQQIPKGTPAKEISASVTKEQVPEKVVPADHVASLAEVAGQVASVDLLPDEQILASRFTDPKSLTRDDGDVAVPKGMQEITIQLEPTRVLGGQITPGDKVGVFISAGDETHLVMNQVLVTKVQGGVIPSDASGAPPDANGAQGGSSAAAPDGSVLVTVARNAPDAERIVWASDFGKIWLSKQPKDASPKGARVWTQKEILQ